MRGRGAGRRTGRFPRVDSATITRTKTTGAPRCLRFGAGRGRTIGRSISWTRSIGTPSPTFTKVWRWTNTTSSCSPHGPRLGSVGGCIGRSGEISTHSVVITTITQQSILFLKTALENHGRRVLVLQRGWHPNLSQI